MLLLLLVFGFRFSVRFAGVCGVAWLWWVFLRVSCVCGGVCFALGRVSVGGLFWGFGSVLILLKLYKDAVPLQVQCKDVI